MCLCKKSGVSQVIWSRLARSEPAGRRIAAVSKLDGFEAETDLLHLLSWTRMVILASQARTKFARRDILPSLAGVSGGVLDEQDLHSDLTDHLLGH